MWQLEYSQEAKHYFLDNYPYTFDLLVKIEELRFYPTLLLPEGCTQIDEPNWYWWVVLDHAIIFEKEGNRLTIRTVKPLE